MTGIVLRFRLMPAGYIPSVTPNIALHHCSHRSLLNIFQEAHTIDMSPYLTRYFLSISYWCTLIVFSSSELLKLDDTSIQKVLEGYPVHVLNDLVRQDYGSFLHVRIQYLRQFSRLIEPFIL